MSIHDMNLKGKVVILTGACRGIGRTLAVELARSGASLVILGRIPSELGDTARAVKQAGGEVLPLKADVTKAGHIKEVVRRTVSGFGKVDVLVNNAAALGSVKPLSRIDESEWDSILNINLKGVFLFSQAVIPYMMKQGGGRIVNVISGLGDVVVPMVGAYTTAKAGVAHLTKVLAEELKEYNIQVSGYYHNVLTRRVSPC